MDFDDLDENEEALGPTPEDRREELVTAAIPPEAKYPTPQGKGFASGRKMKMVFLHGGGTNEKIAKMQVISTFKDIPDSKEMMQWHYFEPPHKVPLGWNGDFSLQPFGPDFSVYFERWPFANCQWESWDGIDQTFEAFKEFCDENGPFDGACGFDMGGEFLVQVARKGQEGDARFQKLFRFLILFTTSMNKHLSSLGKERPQTQLRIPAVLSWDNADMNHTYHWYEETVLFWHKDYREVIVHEDNHIPPKLKAGQDQCMRMTRFLEAMQKGDKFKPSDHIDNKLFEGTWLPLVRVPPPAASEGKRKLFVVGDPAGAKDYKQRIDGMKKLKEAGQLMEGGGEKFVVGGGPPNLIQSMELKLGVSTMGAGPFEKEAGDDVEVVFLEASADMKKYKWHPDATVSRQLHPEDIIEDEDHEKAARMFADELVERISLEEEPIAIVALGTGAILAWFVARVFIKERRRVPQALYFVNPPTRLPWSMTAQPGAFVDAKVWHVVHKEADYGPGWRYEQSTCGPFELKLYEGLDAMVKMVVEDFKAS